MRKLKEFVHKISGLTLRPALGLLVRAFANGAKKRLLAKRRCGLSRRESLAKKACSASGQSTVEYVIVLSALLVIVVALGSLMGVVKAGVFVEHAKTSASHGVQDSVGGITDVFGY